MGTGHSSSEVPRATGRVAAPRYDEDKETIDTLRVAYYGNLGLLQKWCCGQLDRNLTKDELFIDGDVNFAYRDDIIRIPQNLIVTGNLDLKSCMKLFQIAENIEVYRDLILDNTPIGNLPKIRVGNHLSLEGCTKLVSIAENISVGGNLTLRFCNKLLFFPKRATLGGDVNVEFCSKLTEIPSSICDLTPRKSGIAHHIYLNGSSISSQEHARLEILKNPAIICHFADDSMNISCSSDSLVEQAKFWYSIAGLQVPSSFTFPKMMAYHRDCVASFLKKLKNSAEFEYSEMQSGLALRVVDLLELLGRDNEDANIVLLHILDSVTSCEDSAIWTLNRVAVCREINRAGENEQALRALGRRVLNLEIIFEQAQKWIQLHEVQDDLSLVLALEVQLREPLNLPISSRVMRFPASAFIPATLENEIIRKASSVSDAEFEVWFQQWAPMRRLRRVEASKVMYDKLQHRQSLPHPDRRNLVGDVMKDPVTVHEITWSMDDLMHHWVETERDMVNRHIDINEMQHEIDKNL